MAGLSNFGRRGWMHRALGLVAAVVLAAASTPAWAVVPVPTGFRLDVSPSARILDALDMKRDGEITANTYMDIIMDESCDNPHLRIRARNKPAFMVTNDAASAAPLTSLTIQMNNGGPFAFSSGDVAGDNFTNLVKNTMYTDAGVSITSSSLSADQKTLTVNFSGLTAGKKAIFNIDLDTTDPNEFMYPDYRMVLFGAPADGGGQTTPATATATFVNAASPAPNSANVSLQFTQVGAEPHYMNQNIRPYVAMDTMEVFEMGGVIPEPSSGMLALAGFAALASRKRRGK